MDYLEAMEAIRAMQDKCDGCFRISARASCSSCIAFIA